MPNPNPSPETRFGAKNGNPNNLGGKTKAQREAEYEASKISAELRLKALSVMQEKINSGEMNALELVNANALKLFKDSEDRAHGTPKQTQELSGPDGEAIPVSAVEFTILDPKAVDEDPG